MRPDAPRVLAGIAASLLTELAPQVQTAFGAQTAGLAAALAGMIAEEFDRAAARLVTENQAMLALFGQAHGVVADSALTKRLNDAVATPVATDLRVSALQAENDRLRAILTDFHAAVEQQPGEPARALNEAIWDELKESTRRRHFTMVLR